MACDSQKPGILEAPRGHHLQCVYMSVFPSFIVFIATFELHEIKPRFTSRNAGLWLLQS